jgi:hypothetical protein
MPTAADLQALFQGVLTPQQLAAQEQAQDQAMMQFYAQDADRPWRVELERSLNTIKKQLPNSPYQQAKCQAEANQAVLSGSTKRYQELLKTGSDPGEAQLAILGDAIDQFAQQGNYDAISALAPTYLALQTKQAQTAKLKQETMTSRARQEKAETETALMPVEQARKLEDSASTRSTQAVQRQKDQFDMAKTDGLQIVDLTNPNAGPVVAQIDPRTQEATITTPDGLPKTLKPGQYRDASSKSGPGSGKPMPRAVANDLSQAGSALDTTEDLITRFRPSFGGYKSGDVGDVDMFIRKNLAGDKTGAADWWATYQAKAQVVRHVLYGSALTRMEKEDWEKAAINPGMRPEVIQANLKRQEEAEHRAVAKLGKGWSMSYGQEQVEAFLGRSLEGADAAEAPAAPAGSGNFTYVPGKGLVAQ